MSRRHSLIGASKPYLYKEEDAEFYYRQTSGGVIMNDSPLVGSIDRIKGQTIAWNQLCKVTAVNNGVLVKDETDTTLDTYKVIANPSSQSTRCLRFTITDKSIPSNHKVLSVLIFKSNFTNQPYLRYLDGGSNTVGSASDVSYSKGAWNTYMRISNGITAGLSSGLVVQTAYIEGEYISLPKNGGFQVYDLTLIYGEGNEPTTVAQFEADYQRWFGKPLTYEPYDAGSLKNVQMEGIKTTFTNANPQTRNFDVTALTGKLNGEGESVVIFPDGMKGVNDVKDEIYVEDGVTKAVKRIGSREYQSGDESNSNVITDGTITYYELTEPQVYVLDTLLPIAYNCEASGTEQILPEEIGTGIAPIMDITYKIGQINN